MLTTGKKYYGWAKPDEHLCMNIPLNTGKGTHYECKFVTYNGCVIQQYTAITQHKKGRTRNQTARQKSQILLTVGGKL